MRVETSLLRNAMLFLALDKSLGSRTMMLSSYSTKALSTHRPAAALAFSMLPSRYSNLRHSLSKTRMVSTDMDLSPEQLEARRMMIAGIERSQQSTTPNEKTNLLHTVMVRRNRQSAAFREGTPLIFGGSVVSTFTEDCNEEDPLNINADSNIPIGSLVAVAVSRDAPPKGKGKKDSRGKNKRNSNSSDKKEKEEVAVPHHSFSSADRETEHRDNINQSQLIGFGVFNPESMYRVRLLCHETMHPGLTKDIRSIRKQAQRGKLEEDDSNSMILKLIIEKKISDAIYTRLAMQLPTDGITDTYRLVNGEGDGLSGLAIDILGGSTAIVMSSAAWCEIHKDTILSVVEKSLKGHPSYADTDIDVVWRNTPSRLRQDGYEILSESSSDDGDEKEDVSVVATESSVKYITYPYSDGQKTGFYCDQRENRLMVAELCKDKRVLDLCCYNGGFALNAMIRGGAASATGVDSSQDAVDAATANAQLNELEDKDISFVKDDISTFMKIAIQANDEYDVVVLDPPKLAPSLSLLDKASRKYHALNRDAMNLIDKSQGGLLLTCSCSAAMSQKDGGQYFLKMVNGAALSAKRRVTLLKVGGAAPCHTQSPASFPAGQYLTAALFHVGPADDVNA